MLQVKALHHAARACGLIHELEITQHVRRVTGSELVEQLAPHPIPIRSHKYDGAGGGRELLPPHVQDLCRRWESGQSDGISQACSKFRRTRSGGQAEGLSLIHI